MTGVDPAAEFLLDLAWPNLFEPAHATQTDKLTFRCKGCGDTVARSDREHHFNHHRGVRRRSETMRARRVQRERIENLARAREARSHA